MSEIQISDPIQIEREAERKANIILPFFRNWRRTTAAELYEKAAKAYLKDKNCNDSARCLIKAGELYELLNESYNSCDCFLKSARLLKKCSPEKKDLIMSLYDRYCKLSEDPCEDKYMEIGEYLKSICDYDEASKYFNNALLEYEFNGKMYGTNKCLDNLVCIYINSNEYEKAGLHLLRMYENMKTLNDRLVVTAILSFVLYDTVQANIILEKHMEKLNEYDINFLQKTIEYVSSKDGEALFKLFDGYNLMLKIKSEHKKIVSDIRTMFSSAFNSTFNKTSDKNDGEGEEEEEDLT